MWKEKIKNDMLKTEKRPTFFSTQKMPVLCGLQTLFHKFFPYDYYYEKKDKID